KLGCNLFAFKILSFLEIRIFRDSQNKARLSKFQIQKGFNPGSPLHNKIQSCNTDICSSVLYVFRYVSSPGKEDMDIRICSFCKEFSTFGSPTDWESCIFENGDCGFVKAPFIGYCNANHLLCPL